MFKIYTKEILENLKNIFMNCYCINSRRDTTYHLNFICAKRNLHWTVGNFLNYLHIRASSVYRCIVVYVGGFWYIANWLNSFSHLSITVKLVIFNFNIRILKSMYTKRGDVPFVLNVVLMLCKDLSWPQVVYKYLVNKNKVNDDYAIFLILSQQQLTFFFYY